MFESWKRRQLGDADRAQQGLDKQAKRSVTIQEKLNLGDMRMAAVDQLYNALGGPAEPRIKTLEAGLRVAELDREQAVMAAKQKPEYLQQIDNLTERLKVTIQQYESLLEDTSDKTQRKEIEHTIADLKIKLGEMTAPVDLALIEEITQSERKIIEIQQEIINFQELVEDTKNTIALEYGVSVSELFN